MRLIVSTMKNEGAFILEWAAHHLAIGFDRFLVYTNDCEDGTDAIWARLAELGYAAHERNDDIRARGVQKTALMRADTHPLRAKAEWITSLDVDEFINVKLGEGRIDDLFTTLPEAEMVMLAWRRFGSARRARYEDRPVTDLFSRAAPEICPYPFHNYGAKSLWRNDAGWARIGVHRPLDPDPARLDSLRAVNAEGRALTGYAEKGLWLQPEMAGYAAAQINHYALRSAECFLMKAALGLANSRFTSLDLGYWAERNFNQVEDRTIELSAGLRAEWLARLTADAVLADLHETAVAWRRARIAALLDEAGPLKLWLQLIATETLALDPAAASRLNPLIARSWELERAARRG